MTLKPAAKSVTEHAARFTDLSTTDGFLFVFRCDLCGAGTKSERYVFNTDGFDSPVSAKARELLWLRQHDEAYARAVDEARFEFNTCPRCGRRVCNDCFRESYDGAADRCAACRREESEAAKRTPALWRARLRKKRGSLC